MIHNPSSYCQFCYTAVHIALHLNYIHASLQRIYSFEPHHIDTCKLCIWKCKVSTIEIRQHTVFSPHYKTTRVQMYHQTRQIFFKSDINSLYCVLQDKKTLITMKRLSTYPHFVITTEYCQYSYHQ